jgi:transposase-like protein
MARRRRRFSAQEKVAILRRHLVEKVPVSDLCDEHGLNPSLFYRWQKEFFEHGAAAFERRKGAEKRRLEERLEALQTKLSHKDEVIAQIMESHVALKKTWPGLKGGWTPHDVRETMTERDVETILQRARERFPDARPRIISDNGPQFIAKDFKTFIRLAGMTPVRISPRYPQSNGKQERFHHTVKSECIRPGKTPHPHRT